MKIERRIHKSDGRTDRQTELLPELLVGAKNTTIKYFRVTARSTMTGLVCDDYTSSGTVFGNFEVSYGGSENSCCQKSLRIGNMSTPPKHIAHSIQNFAQYMHLN